MKVVEHPAAHAVPLHEIARCRGIERGLEPDAERELGAQPLGDPDPRARRGREPRARPAPRAPRRPPHGFHHRLQVARHERHRDQHVESQEALRGKAEPGERSAAEHSGDVGTTPPPAPHEEQRPQRDEHRQAVGAVRLPVDGKQLDHVAEHGLVPPPQRELERLDQRPPSERVRERSCDARESEPGESGCRARTTRGDRVNAIDREQQQQDPVGDVNVGPHEGDRGDPAAPVAAAVAPAFEDRDLERDEDGGQALRPHLGAQAVREPSQRHHGERHEPARPHAPRRDRHQRKRQQRRRPAVGEQSSDPEPGPQRPDQGAKPPRRSHLGIPVAGPCPLVGSRNRVARPHRLSDDEELPQVGVVKAIGNGDQDRRRGHQHREHERGMGGRERRRGLRRACPRRRAGGGARRRRLRGRSGETAGFRSGSAAHEPPRLAAVSARARPAAGASDLQLFRW